MPVVLDKNKKKKKKRKKDKRKPNPNSRVFRKLRQRVRGEG